MKGDKDGGRVSNGPASILSTFPSVIINSPIILLLQISRCNLVIRTYLDYIRQIKYWSGQIRSPRECTKRPDMKLQLSPTILTAYFLLLATHLCL